MALNRSCTPGWTEDVYSGDIDDPASVPTGEVVGCCGCGWEQGGFTSATQAKKAQREHRFPGPNPKEKAC